jgi:hypothetical protein
VGRVVGKGKGEGEGIIHRSETASFIVFWDAQPKLIHLGLFLNL